MTHGASEREKILVIGATGFAGGALARELRRRGHPVRAMVRPTSDVRGLVEFGVELAQGDITCRSDVDRAVAGVQKIYNLASPYRSQKHSDDYFRAVDVGGVENVLEAARRHQVARVIHCSTIGVHGSVQQFPANEDAPFAPGDVYQRMKLEGEKLARAAFASGLPGVVVRPAGIYGPGDTRLLKLFRGIHRGTFFLFGSGETLFHPVYIDDLVDGFLRCGEANEALGDVFILAGPRALSLNELSNLIRDAVGARRPVRRLPLGPLMLASRVCESVCRPFGIEPPLHERRAHFFTHNRCFTSEKARLKLGYIPKVDVEEGVRRTAAWYFENGYLQPHRRSAAHRPLQRQTANA